MCIATFGFGPSARWNAALAVSDQSSKIYVFGGSNHSEGYCSNKLYCLDLSSPSVKGYLAETRQCLDEVGGLMKSYYRTAAFK
jgi:hypothetical protein